MPDNNVAVKVENSGVFYQVGNHEAVICSESIAFVERQVVVELLGNLFDDNLLAVDGGQTIELADVVGGQAVGQQIYATGVLPVVFENGSD